MTQKATTKTSQRSRSVVNRSQRDAADQLRYVVRPRQERLEDIFADLFADQPLPSLR